jgi:sec-independent protein translocase protein TatA
MGFIGGHIPELIILLVVILIIWGPGKLPSLGAGLGRGIREFRKASSEDNDGTNDTKANPPAQAMRSDQTGDTDAHQPPVSG